MAVTEKKTMWQWSGASPKIVERPIAASQGIYMAGTPCYVCTAGTVKIIHTTDGASHPIHGFICEGVAAELAVNTLIKIALVDKDAVYALFCDSSDTDSAVTQAAVGNKYGFTVSAVAGHVGYTTLNLGSGSTNVQALVHDIASNFGTPYSTSDNPGVALVKIPVAYIQVTAS